MAERGEEAIRGPVGGLGLGPGPLFRDHPHPFLLGAFELCDIAQNEDPAGQCLAVAKG